MDDLLEMTLLQVKCLMCCRCAAGKVCCLKWGAEKGKSSRQELL